MVKKKRAERGRMERTIGFSNVALHRTSAYAANAEVWLARSALTRKGAINGGETSLWRVRVEGRLLNECEANLVKGMTALWNDVRFFSG